MNPIGQVTGSGYPEKIFNFVKKRSRCLSSLFSVVTRTNETPIGISEKRWFYQDIVDLRCHVKKVENSSDEKKILEHLLKHTRYGTPSQRYFEWLSDKYDLDSSEKISILKDLMSVGIDVNLCNDEGKLALNQMIHRNEVGHFLIENGADPLLEDYAGRNAFFYTTDSSMWKFMCQKAKIDMKHVGKFIDKQNKSLLTSVLLENKESSEIFKLADSLIENGVEVNVRFGKLKETLLHAIVNFGATEKIDTLRYLISKGLDVNVVNAGGFTALRNTFGRAIEDYSQILRGSSSHREILERNISFAVELLRNGAKFDEKSWDSASLIVSSCDPQIRLTTKNLVREICKRVDFATYGWSPLLFAANCGLNKMLIKQLQVAPESIDDPCKGTNYRATPLHLSARGSHLLTTFILLEKGANPQIRNWNGLSPYSYYCNPINEILDRYRNKHKVDIYKDILGIVQKARLLDNPEEDINIYDLQFIEEYCISKINQRSKL